jgi:hypothetical protein
MVMMAGLVQPIGLRPWLTASPHIPSLVTVYFSWSIILFVW